MRQTIFKTVLSVGGALLICISALWMPLLCVSTSAATMKQDFESFSNAGENFSVYTATGAGDSNVHSGSKSLRFVQSTGTKVSSLYSDGLSLEVGTSYTVKLWFKMDSCNGTGLELTELVARSNGWSYEGDTVHSIKYIGTNYTSVGVWEEFSVTFTAKKQYLGLKIWGADSLYVDDITITPNVSVNVTFDSNGGSPVTAINGASGTAMTLPAAPTKDDYIFAGWYTDAACKNAYIKTVYPDTDTTLFARWVEKGVVAQDFEAYTLPIDANNGFSVYTAADATDTNVYEGSHSMYKDGSVTDTKAIALTEAYANLEVGKAYKMTYMMKVTDYGTGSGLNYTDLNVRTNAWAYNKMFDIMYIGSDYTAINEWSEVTIVFIATTKYFGFASWGGASYYLDDFKLVEVPVVTLSFETGEGKPISPITGPAGMKLQIDNPEPPEGKSFAGWYSDPELTEAYRIFNMPDTNLTLYAKWILEGYFEQGFEAWPYVTNTDSMSQNFSLYTAKNSDDPNVYSGKHSLYYNSNNNRTYGFTMFDSTMGKLVLGEKYQVSIRYKPTRVVGDQYSSQTTYTSIYNTTVRSNAWSYQSQGPIGFYKAFAIYNDDIGDNWGGTSNAVNTSTVKDKNGWLTMTYELTATTPYIALYMSGDYAMYIDDIVIAPLPSGLISEKYPDSYCEKFYNTLKNIDFNLAYKRGDKTIYKLDLSKRGDYIFAASMKKSAFGNSEIYLAWDAEGTQVIDGTAFAGTTDSFVRSASRVMTSFDGVFYLVLEQCDASCIQNLMLYPRQFSKAENPNVDVVYNPVNYDALPAQQAGQNAFVAADDDTGADDGGSPATGESGMAAMLVVVTGLVAMGALTLSGKRGNKHEN